MLSMYLTWDAICGLIHESGPLPDVSSLLSDNKDPERVLTRNPARLTRIVLAGSRNEQFQTKELLALSDGKDLRKMISAYLASHKERFPHAACTKPLLALSAEPKETIPFGYFLTELPKKDVLCDETIRFEPEDPIFYVESRNEEFHMEEFETAVLNCLDLVKRQVRFLAYLNDGSSPVREEHRMRIKKQLINTEWTAITLQALKDAPINKTDGALKADAKTATDKIPAWRKNEPAWDVLCRLMERFARETPILARHASKLFQNP